MQVKKRLQINVALSVLTACIIIPMLILTAYRVGKAVEAQGIAGDIITGAFERVALRNDYVRNNSERARIQWFGKHEQIGRLLKAASQAFTDPEDRVLLADLARDQGSLFNLFSGIVENREKTASGAYSIALSQERENRLVSQLNMKVYDTVLLARRLHGSADSRMFSAFRFFGWGVIVVISILAMLAIANSWSMRRTITDRIERLRHGAAVIGEGDLGHRIEIEGDDEFAELSQAFDTMTEKLRGSYFDLEREIEERKRTNEELQRTATFLGETQAIAHVGGWEIDLVENTLFWTEETYRIHETSPSEYKPTVETAIAFYAPESVPVISAAVKNAIEHGKEFHLELQLITAKDRRIWVAAVGKAIRSDGRVVKVVGAFQDVTERKQAEAAKQLSAYNRSLLEASLDPLVTIDANGKVTDVNAATEKVTGCARAELIGTDFSDYFTEPDKARAGYQQVFREGKVMDYDLEIRHRDGHITPVLYNAAVYRDEGGSVIGVFAAARDITERKQAEEKLKLANAYNRSLLEASLDPLVTIDADGKITDVNAATEKVTGRSRAGLVGTDFSNYFTDPDKARAGYRQVFEEGLVMDYALEIRRGDGFVTPVLYNAAVYRDGNGSVAGVFAAARDITERKHAEEKLRLANAYNRSLLEASLDPLVTIDADGKITDVNLATEKVTGRSRAELIGTDFSDYFTEPAKAEAGYQQVFDEGFVMDYALEIRRRDGLVTPVLYNAAVYSDKAGNVIGVFAAARDITERKRAEDEIRKLNRELEARVVERTAQLEASNKELEAFAYSVSHDLRTPLRGIDGFSLALLEDYTDKLDEIGRDYLRRVRAGALKMGQLIDALLNLSRLTRGEVRRVSVDLSALAKTAAEELRKSEPGRSVEFIIADTATVKGDPVMLRAVIDNLLGNAWKFTGKRDAGRIEFGVFECGTRKSEFGMKTQEMCELGKTIYFIRDNGSGFDMTYANKLFTAFQRLHGTTDFPGLGIGLATVQRIMHRHGGRVWAEGEVEKGATFFFTLG